MSETLFREVIIDTKAISENVARIRGAVGVDVIAVVKANGYGHGAVEAARAALAGGAVKLGVADIGEALELRDAGIEAPILAWLHGAHTDFSEAAARRIELGISSLEQLSAAAAAAAPGRPTRVHLKLETGLARNGAAPEEWDELFARAAELEQAGSICVAGMFSHLANSGVEPDMKALGVFQHALEVAASHGVTPETRHLAASEAALRLPEARLDAVRVGIAIYGLPPAPGVVSEELGLRPAMTFRAGVAKVRRVPAGTGVSYGHTYVTDRETTLALVPLGYADGVTRAASDRGPVVINGKRYRVAGRVAMDQFLVDVGDDEVHEGDVATLFGDPTTGAPTAEEWAEAAGTINYEFVTRIGARVPRVFI